MSEQREMHDRPEGCLSYKPCLYLLTDGFPYGPGEKPFIIPELKALSRRFSVTILSPSYDRLIADEESRTSLDNDVSLITYRYPKPSRYLLLCLKFFISRSGWREVKAIVGDGFSIGRLMDSVASYAIAERLRRFCVRKGIFNNVETTLYYSFWFGNVGLALALQHEKNPETTIVGRLNGYDLYNERNLHGRQPFKKFMRDQYDLMVFGADYPRSYFEKTFGPERLEGQYFINRLGVVRQDVRTQYSSKEFLLVSCSNVIPLKRVDLIACALSRLPNKPIRWVHFGDGSELSRVQEIVASSGINAELRGAVGNEDVLDFYRDNNVSCFITTSSSEGGFPVSIQEAMSFGIPIIGTDAGGAIREGIDGNGILLDNDVTEEGVADAIHRLADLQQDEWEELSRRSLQLWSERYNVEVNKQLLIEKIEKLLDR